MSWLGHLRQWLQPEEFRISPPRAFPGIESELQQLVKAISELPQAGQEEPEAASGPIDKAYHKFLADLGTRLWRLRNRMTKPGSKEALPGMEKAFRFFESAWDALAREKIDVVDYTNEVFDPGVPLEVIGFEKRNNLVQKMIIETIKPTIYYGDHLIQAGQVMVGIPDNE